MLTDNFKVIVENYLGKGFLSNEFRLIMEKKLTEDFYNKTKIIDKEGLIYLSMDTNYAYISEFVTQAIKVSLGVINTGFHTWITWRMKSDRGIPVRPFHTDIDEHSFDMWFEDLPVEDILKVYHKEPPKINIDENSLHFNLIVGHFFNESTYLIIQCPNSLKNEIADFIGTQINSWNENSENNKRKFGLIHNGRVFKDSEDNELIYLIDFGSASEIGLIHLLEQLNKFDSISEIKITSFVT